MKTQTRILVAALGSLACFSLNTVSAADQSALTQSADRHSPPGEVIPSDRPSAGSARKCAMKAHYRHLPNSRTWGSAATSGQRKRQLNSDALATAQRCIL